MSGTDGQAQTALTVNPARGLKRNNSTEIATSKTLNGEYVSHLTPGQVRIMAIMATKKKLHGERNALLIKTIFDSALRISEALGLRPVDIEQDASGWAVVIRATGSKGNKPGRAAISAGVAAELQAFAYRHSIDRNQEVFDISRSQAFRIIQASYKAAGLRVPCTLNDRTGAVHILRHSGAVERLKATGNARSVQQQLRHKSAGMTMRYFKTVTADEGLQVQQGVDVWQSKY